MISLEKKQVYIPSPGKVSLLANSKLTARFQGNIDYLKYLLEHSGEFMLSAFSHRSYSPGKLLERVWDGEYAGKWLDAATRGAIHNNDSDFITAIDEFASRLREFQQPDGFMGQPMPTDRDIDKWEIGWNIWTQWTSMIGLLTHYELRGNKQSLECAKNIGDWVVRTYTPIKDQGADFLKQGIGYTNLAVINQMMRLHQHTQNQNYCFFVKSVITKSETLQKMLQTGRPNLVHPYMLGAVLTGMIDFSVASGDEKMFDTTVTIWREIVANHLFPTGSLGEDEDLYSGTLKDNPDGKLQETCATTEWIFLTQRLYELTGEGEFADALEKTTYNALLAAQSDDGMKWCYYTPLRYSKHFFHGPTRCCFWSGPRGIARIPSMIYAYRENEIIVNFFESSKVIFEKPNGPVEIEQESQFPATGSSEIVISSPIGWQGIISIRIPKWSSNFSVRVAGIEQPLNRKDSYISIKLGGASRYKIHVYFDMPLIKKIFSGENYALQRGPEILSLDLRDNTDTWVGENDLISIPKEICTEKAMGENPWPGFKSTPERRRYSIKLNDSRTVEGKNFIFTPYADAGNDGAAFRTIFPLAAE